MFRTKFAETEGFPSKTETSNNITEFGIVELVLVENFSRNSKFWHFFWAFAQNGVSRLKQEHWKEPLNSAYSNESRDQISA